MEKIENGHIPVLGSWRWRQTAVPWQGEWMPLKEFSRDEHIWTFRADGVMTSLCEGHPCYCTVYSYDPQQSLLVLDGYDLDPEGNRHAAVNERYSCSFVGTDSMLLYDVEDFMGVPGIRLRLQFSRMKI